MDQLNHSMEFSMLIQDEIKGHIDNINALQKQVLSQDILQIAHLFNKGLANEKALKQQRAQRIKDVFRLSTKVLELQEKLSETQDLKTKNLQLSKLFSNEKSKTSGLEKKLQALQSDLKGKEQIVDQVLKSDNQSNAKVAQISLELTKVKSQLAVAQNELLSKEENFKKEKETLFKQYQNASNEISELLTKNKEANQKLSIIEEENLELVREKQQAVNALNALKSNQTLNAATLIQTQQQLINLKTNLTKTQQQLKSVLSQICQANKTIQQMNHESRVVYTQLDELKIRQKALKGTLESLNSDNKVLKQKNRDLTKMNKDFMEIIDKLRPKNKKLKTQTDEK